MKRKKGKREKARDSTRYFRFGPCGYCNLLIAMLELVYGKTACGVLGPHLLSSLSTINFDYVHISFALIPSSRESQAL